LFSRASFQSQSDSVQSRKGRALSLIRRSRVFWNAARCQAPSVLVATSVWMESRSGDGARLPRMMVPPTACSTATPTRSPSGVNTAARSAPLPRFHASMNCWYRPRTAASSADRRVVCWLMLVLPSRRSLMLAAGVPGCSCGGLFGRLSALGRRSLRAATGQGTVPASTSTSTPSRARVVPKDLARSSVRIMTAIATSVRACGQRRASASGPPGRPPAGRPALPAHGR
jgi:hypothetical protein